ncbi:hypothetical protein JCM8097_001957 [Rhodosporidiobolus ruineniae]
MVSVQMHPQAHRNPAPSSSSASSSSSNTTPTPSPLASSPFFEGIDTLLPSSTSTHPATATRTPTPRRASSSSTPSSSSRRTSTDQLPLHGLTDLDCTVYPLYSNSTHSPEIRVLSAAQYARLHDQHQRVQLPEKQLFPWAHGGADIPHTAAAHYFRFTRGQAAEVPSFRGLTTIYVPPPPPPSRSSSTRSLFRRGLAASFSSWSSSSNSSSAATSSSSSSSSGSPSPPPPSTPTCRLVSAFDASQILHTHPITGQTTFALPDPSAFHTVNLRHFALQAAKYATISDVVVYGEGGIDETVIDMAAKVREAMDREWDRRGRRGVRYNVYVVSDSFSTFERNFAHLVSIDSLGFSRNRINFFEREKEEMRVLTQASEIGGNVWLGNTQDVPMAKTHARPLSSDSASSLVDDGNPYSFSICIESHDGAPLMTPGTLALADGALNVLESQGQAYEEVRRLCSEQEGYAETTTTMLRPHVDDLIHLEALSTSSALGTSQRHVTAYVNQLVDLACWIRDQAAPPPLTRGNHLPRRILLHCGDGYTETSLLALTYVMVSRRCAAADAYKFLQDDCGRSFFVYPADRETVLQLERRVLAVLDREDDEEAAALRWHAEQQLVVAAAQAAQGGRLSGEGELVVAAASSAGMERSDSGFVDSSSPAAGSAVQVDPLAKVALEDATREIERQLEEELNRPRAEMRLSDPQRDAWFFGPTFEGHFPSRILPWLYLGNLNHASNALMLKELGITHVVSLGESALNPPRAPSTFANFASSFRSSSPNSAAALPDNSLWLEERLGNIAVLDMKNIADDGIDSVRPCIDEAVAFIEAARLQGGRILVHCKVGVSRSASIVIAYLMKHVHLDLSSAYLLTRSRRLNILIQPNLPFMATLHAYEAALLDERDEARQLRRAQSAHSISADSDASVYSSASSTSANGFVEDDDEDDDLAQRNFGRAGLKRSNRLGFSFLCKEIAKLNERFLCCL